MMAAYIFVREDGRIFQIAEEPTPEDVEHAKAGLVTIIRTSDGQALGRAGVWAPIQDGVIAQPDPSETESPPFHVPAEF